MNSTSFEPAAVSGVLRLTLIFQHAYDGQGGTAENGPASLDNAGAFLCPHCAGICLTSQAMPFGSFLGNGAFVSPYNCASEYTVPAVAGCNRSFCCQMLRLQRKILIMEPAIFSDLPQDEVTASDRTSSPGLRSILWSGVFVRKLGSTFSARPTQASVVNRSSRPPDSPSRFSTRPASRPASIHGYQG